MAEPDCPVCGSTAVVKQEQKHRPEDFGFTGLGDYSLYRCRECTLDFFHPRKGIDYQKASTWCKTYEGFVSEEEFRGRLDFVRRATSHWKDSPLVYEILKGLEGRGSLLDFGAGSGYMTELARELGFTVTAVDTCGDFREFIGKMIPGTSVHRSLDDLRGREGSFDVILALHILEHLEEPSRTVETLASLLSPGGILVAAVPNASRAYYRLGEIGREIEELAEWDGVCSDFAPNHLNRFTPRALARALELGGFGNVAVGCSPVNAWDLFHTGLGDERFRYGAYSSDPGTMITIARVEYDLNRLLDGLGLGELGFSLVALAAKEAPADSLDALLSKARTALLDTYVGSVEEDFDRASRGGAEHRDSLEAAIREKDRYIADLEEKLTASQVYGESLRESIRNKDRHYGDLKKKFEEKETYIESILGTLEEKDAYIGSLAGALDEKDAYLASIRETIEEKDTYIASLRDTLAKKEEYLKVLAEGNKEGDRG